MSNNVPFVRVWIPLKLIESFESTVKPKEYYLKEEPGTICVSVPIQDFKLWTNTKQLLKG